MDTRLTHYDRGEDRVRGLLTSSEETSVEGECLMDSCLLPGVKPDNGDHGRQYVLHFEDRGALSVSRDIYQYARVASRPVVMNRDMRICA